MRTCLTNVRVGDDELKFVIGATWGGLKIKNKKG
jgi:hypothetical protein